MHYMRDGGMDNELLKTYKSKLRLLNYYLNENKTPLIDLLIKRLKLEIAEIKEQLKN